MQMGILFNSFTAVSVLCFHVNIMTDFFTLLNESELWREEYSVKNEFVYV